MRRVASIIVAAIGLASAQQAQACGASSWMLQHQSFHVHRSAEAPFTIILGDGGSVTADIVVEINLLAGDRDLRPRDSGSFVEAGVVTRSPGSVRAVFKVVGAGTGTIAVDMLDGSGKVIRTVSHAVKVEVRPRPRC